MRMVVLISLLATLLVLPSGLPVHAQEAQDDSTSSNVQEGSPGSADTAGGGPRSAWVGAEVAYGLNGGPAADNFQASGRAVLEVLGKETRHRGIYVLGNLSRLKTDPATEDERTAEKLKLSELQQSSQGIHLAVVPHWVNGDETNESRTFWVALGWKLNALKDAADTLQYLHQARLGVGFEITGLRGKYSQLPVSASIEPALVLFDKEKYAKVFGEEKGALLTADLQLIIPAGTGRGVLFRSAITAGQRPDFKVGLLLTTSKESTTGAML